MKAKKFNLKKVAEKAALTMKVYGFDYKHASLIWAADYNLTDEQLAELATETLRAACITK